MGVLDKFKDLVGIGEEYYDDEDYITEEEIAQAEHRMSRQEYEKPKFSRNMPQRNNVVHMGGMMEAMKLVVIEPTSFEDSPKLVESLKDRKPIIINLEKIDAETARKIFDFLSGATYALNGNVQKIANNIFVFAPENVDISSSDSDHKDFDFSSMDDSWR